MTGIGARHWISALVFAIIAHLGLGYLIYDVTRSPVPEAQGGITVSLAPIDGPPGASTGTAPPAEVVQAAMAPEHVHATLPPQPILAESQRLSAIPTATPAEPAKPTTPQVRAVPEPRRQALAAPAPDSAAVRPEAVALTVQPKPAPLDEVEPEQPAPRADPARPRQSSNPARKPGDSAARHSAADSRSDPTDTADGAAHTGSETVIAKAQPGNPQPHYPRIARRRGFEGKVVVRAAVLKDGTVGRVHIEQSSGHRTLDEAARKAVRAWRFQPATRAGHAVESTIDIPVTFRLRAGS